MFTDKDEKKMAYNSTALKEILTVHQVHVL